MSKRKISIYDLNLGFNDAENYKKPENKELFNKIFIDSSFLKRIESNNTYFILGEKGTGKTAYAVYFVNNFHKETVGILNYIRETDYQKFITLKKERQLELSDFTSIWKVIIYLLIAEKIKQEEVQSSLFKSSKFASLQKAIEEYYAAAFSPEILQALNFIEKSKFAAEIIAKHAKLTGEKIKETSFTHSKFQTNLFYIQKHFEDAIGSIKLTKNYILFIDGIDIRPRNLNFEEYLECVKGLANALWSINNDFFAHLDLDYKLRVVMLVRPDIYAHLGLQNPNNKLRDNGVLLNWITTFNNYRDSPLFGMVDKLLDADQPFYNELGECWDHYFPYKIQNSKTGKLTDNSFVSFLRFSYYKPRDFVSMLDILKANFIHQNRPSSDVFKKSDFDNDGFRNQYSEYLMSEIKDQILFYNSEEEYQIFIDFFQHIQGKVDFTYEEYCSFYEKYIKHIGEQKIEIPNFLKSKEIFLQFLYNNNVIAYMEDTKSEIFMRWCFRERNYSNISPKVQLNLRYTIHYGLHKALNLGKKIITSNQRTSKKNKRRTQTGRR